MRSKLTMGAAVLFMGLLRTASAGPITGTFNLSGTLTVTQNAISWNSDLLPYASQMFTLTAGAGGYSGENGQNTIENLNILADPVGTSFAPTPFIIFNVVPGVPQLNLTFIYPGSGGSPGCSMPAALNETCTPPNPGGSPFTFTDDAPNGSTSDAKFVFSGTTADGAYWTGIFTSQFPQSYQAVLNGFGPGSSISNSYSGTVTVLPAPEPGSMAMGGLGLIGALLVLRKRRTVSNF